MVLSVFEPRKRKLAALIAALLIGAGLGIGFVKFEYVIYWRCGTDKSGRYSIYRANKTILVVRRREFYSVAVGQYYAARADTPTYSIGPTYVYDAGLAAGETLDWLYPAKARPIYSSRGLLYIWLSNGNDQETITVDQKLLSGS